MPSFAVTASRMADPNSAEDGTEKMPVFVLGDIDQYGGRTPGLQPEA